MVNQLDITIEDKDGNKYETFQFTPSLKELMPDEKLILENCPSKFRMLFRFLFGYTIEYVKKGDECVAFCVLKHRQHFRQPFMEKNDLLIAPYYVAEAYRRHGIATGLISDVVKRYQTGSIFALVRVDNEQSMTFLKKMGFVKIGYVKRKGRILQFLSGGRTKTVAFRYEG